MPKYEVRLPLIGEAIVEVIAASEDDAIEQALDDFKFIGGVDINNGDVTYLEPMKRIVQGNVFYGSLNRAEAQEIESDDDED